MASLDDLYKIIAALDPHQQLAGISYDLTTNNSLGFSGPADFYVPIPYAPWPTSAQNFPATFPSSLGAAFRDTLQQGAASVHDDGSTVFIDISHLAGGWLDFFTKHTSSKVSVVQGLADVVNAMPKSVKPVIRFLVGNTGNSTWQNEQYGYSSVFFPGGQPLITHPNAQLSVGYYQPDFAGSKDPVAAKEMAASLGQVLKDMAENVLALPAMLNAQAKALKEQLAKVTTDEIALGLIKQILPTISWNHAKTLVVNGSTVMTGGGNYWNEYADDAAYIIDTQCKLKGGVATSTHHYCDYFWRYLNRNNKTDQNSFRKTTKLAAEKWTDDQVPITSAKATGAGSVKALSIAKLGDWTGQMNDVEYPVQIIDASRDLLLNVLYQVISAKMPASLSSMGALMATISDQAMAKSYSNAKVTAAAWASRTARNEVIQNASTSLYLSIEIIGNFLQRSNAQWVDLVKEVNAKAELSGTGAWDGVLWPYDFIGAMAKFLLKCTGQAGTGLFLVLTTSVGTGHEGWQDEIPAKAFKDRIRAFVGTAGGATDAAWDAWFNARVQIKRVEKDDQWKFNHSKVVCADKKLLYIGSDNIYPNYNEEHGVWVDDQQAINGWYTGYWTPVWDQSTPAKLT